MAMVSGCNPQLISLDAIANAADHGLIRRHPKQIEMRPGMSLVKNGKFFQLPGRTEDDFKTLFGRAAAAGVGRPVDKAGCPQGPWTAELLADAISQIEENRAGIELRTVQLWFENSDKGISATNIRWLARVLGCNDPEAASAWQAELSAAQARLTARRRAERQSKPLEREEQQEDERDAGATGAPEVKDVVRRIGLARATESMFASGSLLNLPANVFAGAVALQLASYFLSIHDVTYLREDGVTKQLGFLWAPNWTFLFILCLPLFLAIVVDQIANWKTVNRPLLLAVIGGENQPEEWLTRVEKSTHAYWAVFLISIGVAGVAQWMSVRLFPLLDGGGDHAVDWGSIALGRPDVISIGPQAAFTAAAYLYMGVCFYLLIAGLILLCNLVDDFVQFRARLVPTGDVGRLREVDGTGAKIANGLVRCTIAGLLVAICMKLQSLYIVTSAPDIIDWLIADATSVLSQSDTSTVWDTASTPTSYTSLIVAFLVSAVYLYGVLRLGPNGFPGRSLVRPTAAISLLVIAFLLAGIFDGFSILLAIGLIIAIYGLFVPHFGRHPHERRGRGYVL
jgi:hypothetical protein